MAVYTMELRTVCESLVGATEHAEFGGIDNVISRCWEKIFTGAWNTYDPAYKVVLCRKILRHYWMREIGTETAGLFIHYLNTRLDEIMPYFNDLYKSATLEFNPLYDYDLQTTSKRTTDGETEKTSVVSGTGTVNDSQSVEATDNTISHTSGSSSGKITDTNTTTGQDITKYSDTPQGELTRVVDGTYLTNATVVDKTSDSNGERTTNDSSNEMCDNDSTHVSESIRTENRTNESTINDSGTAKTTEDYVLNVKGKTGGKSYSTLLTEYRKTLINIDTMIIDNLHDLFMQIW